MTNLARPASAPARPRAASPLRVGRYPPRRHAGRPDKPLAITSWAAACALAGALCAIVLKLVGEVYAGELLLIPLALVALVAARGARAFSDRRLLVLCLTGVITLLGYVISDVARATEVAQYLRGWGRVILMTTDVACLSILVIVERRNFWWFCLGLAAGTLVVNGLIEHLPFKENWKLVYAPAGTYLILCLASLVTPGLVIVGIGLLAAVGVALDSRAEPFLLLITASVLWARRTKSSRPIPVSAIASRLALPLVLGMALLAAGLALTSGDFDQRREQSNGGRFTSTVNGMRVILQSPVLGQGSWNELDLLDAADLETDELGVTRSVGSGPPHSQILDSWYEGGVLGAAFFVAFGIYLASALLTLTFKAPLDELYPVVFYSLAVGFWDLLMSPFAGNHRISIALGVAAIVVGGSRKNRPGRKGLK